MDISVIGILEDEEILLDIAALALSQLDHEQWDVSAYLKQLDEIEERVCLEGRSAFLASEQAIVLAEVLHHELGFVGDAEGYDAPVNADFIRVLDRRKGLPISLAILYVAMARRAGWEAHVLNGSGHVLVEVGKRRPVVIDPFAGGRQVHEDQLVLFYAGQFAETHGERNINLARMTNRQILARLLFNQAIRAESEHDSQRAITVYDRLTRVSPETLDAWQHLARHQIANGDKAGARASLLAMSELAGNKQLREQILAAFQALGQTRVTKY